MPHISVGAELARDGGVSVDINVDCAAVIASRLTPTVWFWLVSDFVSAKHLVGAELARDGGLSVDINVDCAAVIASKLGSYRGCVGVRCRIGRAVRSTRRPWR